MSLENLKYAENEENFARILTDFKALNDNQDLGNTEQYLIDSLNSENNVCLICIETIGPKEAIWNCEGCFEQFHIFCIQNWIKDGSYQAINLSDDASKIKKIPWNCPKCRKEYKQNCAPTTYFCYCHKVKNPKYDPWIIPHSCNQRCEKSKPCSHQCLMLCHPGPCPPCPKMVQMSCNCSKSSAVPRRCSNQNWSCHKPCNKLLLCKQHLCEKICHEDSCGSCGKTSIQFCQCKKQRKEVLCTETNWQCEQVCSKPYACGSHKCEKVCHDSKSCGECPRSLLRSCPCGKSKSQKPCTFEIPPCGGTCDKPLACGRHSCVQRCHLGECEPCRQIVTKTCRCDNLKQKSLPCNAEFTCETKCTRMRNCGKHKCNKKCCDGDGLNCPPCEQRCNKQLGCKNHKCMSLCHSGPCYPCPIMVELKCPCGLSKQRVPCVKSKLDIRVPCKQICKLPAKCHHDQIQRHTCHYTDCPACNLKCDKALKCGHTCPAKCHSAVFTESIENKNREGPWVKLKVNRELKNLPCPDCLVPMPVKCLGNHEKCNLPCYRAKPYNCGSKCGRLLKCTNHKCSIECHHVEVNEDDTNFNCEECESVCEKERPKNCTHECPIGYCHPGRCPECTSLLKLKCHCNTNFVYVECHKWNSASKKNKERELLQSCHVPCPHTLSCGHSCTYDCHSGECSKSNDCIVKIPIKCVCKTLRKSFVCKELRFERENLLEKKVKGEMKLFLKCADKCKLKQNKLEESNSVDGTIGTSTSNATSSMKSRYFLIAVLVLLVAVIIYGYLNL